MSPTPTPDEHPCWPDGTPMLVGQQVVFDGGSQWDDFAGQEVVGVIGIIEHGEVSVWGDCDPEGDTWDAPFADDELHLLRQLALADAPSEEGDER